MEDHTIRTIALMLSNRIDDDAERDDLEMLADLVNDVRQQNRPELLAELETILAEATKTVDEADEDAQQEADAARWM